MIEELNKHYDEFKEVLDILPTNVKTNIKKKLDYIEEEIKSDDERFRIVKNEIESRVNKLDSLVISNNIEILRTALEKCNIVNEWNNYNTSYEKMHLDYYLYQLHRYYKDDLVTVNACIKRIVDSFKKVEINIVKEDFDFNSSASIYMDKILNNATDEELKNCFEEIYWKDSDLIKTIEINFKSIYLKYEKKIDKYYENRHEEYLKEHKDSDIYDIRLKFYKQLEEEESKDAFLNFKKFVNNEYLLSDYKQVEIDKKRAIYFEENSYSFDKLKELYQVLNEYNIIVKYKYLFDDMKEKLNNKDSLKNSKANALKGINKDENALRKLSSSKDKKSLFGKKKNDEKWLFNYKEVLNNVIKHYDEFDNICFNDIVYERLTQDSTILDILKLITSNYLYFVNKTFELDESQNIKNITDSFGKLKNYVNYNEFIFIDNIALLDEKQMKELITNKYKLEHINLSIDSLVTDNIDKTIDDIKKLINYEYIMKSGLNIDDISLYLDYKKMIKN